MTANFPRLLVATEFTPNSSGGGPAIVRQMLKHWPTEKLFWWSCLTSYEADFGQRVTALTHAPIPERLYPHRRYRAIKSWFLENIWTRWSASTLQKAVDHYKPDVIWCIPHGWSIPPLGLVLANTGITVHASIHDYADINSCAFRFGRERTARMAATADRLYANATTRDAISEPMITDLRARTGRDGAIVRAGMESEDFAYLESKRETTSDEIRIAYAGSIIVEETFALFVQALERLRPKLSKRLSLEFFSAHSYRTRGWFDSAWMHEHGLVSEAMLSNALKNFSWGLSPMSLTDEDPRYNRFSLPTKVASYLAAGLPVIIIGHPESTVVKLARTYKIGCCIRSADPAAIENKLFSALSLPNPWLQFQSEIQRCAHAEFDANQMRVALHQSLSSGIRSSHSNS